MDAVKPALDGLVLRPYAGKADIPAIVDIINAEWRHDGVPGRVTVAEKAAEFGHPSAQFDARRDVTLAEVDGRPVGYCVRGWTDVADSELREYATNGSVEPGWRGRGVGRALLRDSMRRLKAQAGQHDTPRARVFGSTSNDGQAADEALLRSEGFEAVRYFFWMTRDHLDDVVELPLPDGLVIRPLTRADVPRVFAADAEAFRDHWGGFEDSPEELQRWLDSPELDPSLWVVAFEGDEIAGGVVNAIYAEENAALGKRRGWLDSVFTRRRWRGRGLARALISRSLIKLRERGMDSAILEVDAENPTGALRLYNSAGFATEYRSTAWRKPFGIDR